MTRATRLTAGFVTVLLAVALADVGAATGSASAAPQTSAVRTSAAHQSSRARSRALTVSIDTVSPDIRRGTPVTVTGTVSNPGDVPWSDARAYFQISPYAATNLAGLANFAKTPPDTGIGNLVITPHDYDRVGDVGPHESQPFSVTIPYDDLTISGVPGVYRIGIKVIAGTPDGVRDPNDAARANTLVPLLPPRPGRLDPVQTVTLLPITAPVKRLLDGEFADDSLAPSLAYGGRLYDVLHWALSAAPGTVQVVLDPSLFAAISDMSHGYRVETSPPSTASSMPGAGKSAAISWLADFATLAGQQHVLLMPWGVPAANSLLANHVPGPVLAAIRSSNRFARAHGLGSGVAGWLTDGRSGIPALTVMHHAGADLQIVSQASVPGLDSYQEAGRPVPSLIDVAVGARRIPVLVAAATLGGFPVTPDMSALDFRQRLLADATVRSLSGQTTRVAVTALPFTWDPGPTASGQDLASAFEQPVIAAQSAVGAIDRPGQRYSGPVRSGPSPWPSLSPEIFAAIRQYHISGGDLSSILRPSPEALRDFQHVLAMAGSAEWHTFSQLGVELVNHEVTSAQEALAKVTVTGPPFVAMSSTSGRFPLTVTNGLNQPITVRLAVKPEDPALRIAPLDPITLPANQRRDIQVVTTADGSGVTTVHARLATRRNSEFGNAWKFDVRATQIGLVIWVVIGVGAAVLFIAAGYRIVNRLRGKEPSRPRRAAG